MKNSKQPQGRWKKKSTYLLKNGAKPCDLWSLPKCQAKAKSTGKQCGNIAVKGKEVCYLHGGKSPGAKYGNQHAYKHGHYTAHSKAMWQCMQQLLKDSNDLLDRI